MGSGCIDPHFLDLDTSWRWVVSFTPRPLYTGEGAPGTHWIRSCVGPRARLDVVEKRIFFTLPGLKLRPLSRPARNQSLYRLRCPGSLRGWCKVFYFKVVSHKYRHFCSEIGVNVWHVALLVCEASRLSLGCGLQFEIASRLEAGNELRHVSRWFSVVHEFHLHAERLWTQFLHCFWNGCREANSDMYISA
jgi:hypothetical protein